MDEVVEFCDVECIAETDKALLVRLGDEEHWVPKSVVHDDSEIFAKGDVGELVVMEWFAKKNGLA